MRKNAAQWRVGPGLGFSMSIGPLRWLGKSTAAPAGAGPSDHDSDLVAWSPLTFLVDSDEVGAQRTAAIMSHHGVENLIVPDSHALADALSMRTPDMIMVDVPAEGIDAIDTILMLGERNFGGSVQLTGEP